MGLCEFCLYIVRPFVSHTIHKLKLLHNTNSVTILTLVASQLFNEPYADLLICIMDILFIYDYLSVNILVSQNN